MKGNSGFSLVEVLCAILILGVGLVGLTQGVTTAVASSKDAEVQSAAALLAAGQIETLRAEGYLIEGESEGEGEGALSNYTWIQNVTETKTEGLYEVSVKVQKTGSGEELFELKTMLFDPPIVREPEETEEKRNGRERRPAP